MATTNHIRDSSTQDREKIMARLQAFWHLWGD